MRHELVPPSPPEAGKQQRGERTEGREGGHLHVADHLAREGEQGGRDQGYPDGT